MRIYTAKYNGEIYSNVEIPFLNWGKINIVELDEIPSSIDKINEVNEDDNFIELKLGERIAEIEDGKLNIKEIWLKTIKFEKANQRSLGDKLEMKDIPNIESEEYFDNFNVFLNKIVQTNENVFNYLKTYPSLFNVASNSKQHFKLNVYNLIIFNLLEFEKLINSDNLSFLEANLENPKFEISEASKLNQAIGVPKFAIKELKDLSFEEAIEGVKILSKTIDGNSLKIVFAFLKKMKIFYTKNYDIKNRGNVINTFLKDISFICERGYKITDLLNYLLRQSFYFNDNNFFGFPDKEAMYLKDYIRMCERYGLKYEKYPAQIKKMHDIISKNIVALDKNSDELEEQFKKAVMEYQEVEKEVELTIKNPDGTTYEKKYCFIVPKTIKDLIQEGNDLHHCVGSYSDLVIDKKARIVFLRDASDVKKSLVTIDIDENYSLVEAKKAYNDDPDDEHIKVINKWIRQIKKAKR